MNKFELAKMLDGRQYGSEIDEEVVKLAKENDLVIVYGALPNVMIFQGAIEGEVILVEDDPKVYIDNNGLLIDKCDCRFFEDAKKKAKVIEAVWCQDEEGWPWTYKTYIPHTTFQIFEEEKISCKGFVFSLSVQKVTPGSLSISSEMFKTMREQFDSVLTSIIKLMEAGDEGEITAKIEVKKKFLMDEVDNEGKTIEKTKLDADWDITRTIKAKKYKVEGSTQEDFFLEKDEDGNLVVNKVEQISLFGI